jgi:hypothetical protein
MATSTKTGVKTGVNRRAESSVESEKNYLKQKVQSLESQLFYIEHESMVKRHHEEIAYIVKQERRRASDQWLIGFITGALYVMGLAIYYKKRNGISGGPAGLKAR